MYRNKAVVVATAALAATTVIASCSNPGTDQQTASPSTVATSSTAAPAAAHNQADVMFTRHMIPHHQQAVQMSDMILAKQDVDPRVIDLAKQIKAAQGPEIEKMQGWLTQWGMPAMNGMPGMDDMMPGPSGMPGNMAPDHGGMHGPDPDDHSPGDHPSGATAMPQMPGMAGMDGMMSPAEMQGLQRAQGVDATKLFLTGMIKHHQGAITMAQDEIQNGQFPETVALAKSIATSQQKEIDTMNQILASL